MRRYLYRLILFTLLFSVLGGVVMADMPAQISNLGAFIFDVRADLEILADAVLEGAPRPDDWTGNNDVNSPNAIPDLWFDNELLANQVFGHMQRPADWMGAVTPDALIIARNVRHDLELTAAEFFGGSQRPAQWRGGPPLMQCSRSLQNVIGLLADMYNINFQTPESVVNYCRSVEVEAEDELVTRALSQSAEADLPDQILALRGDLERLADERLGVNTRPQSWIGNKDRESATLIADNFLDLETLADTTLGSGVRPSAWIGLVTSSAVISYRNLRHDLELLSDLTLDEHTRPHGWQGESRVGRCSPTVQNLVLLVTAYGFDSDAIEGEGDEFCTAAAQEANYLAENRPEELVEAVPDRLIGESQHVFAYLDVAATKYMGIMPSGVNFRAWYRNFSESQMMFVSGDDFALFIDRRWTTLPQSVFDSLPTLEGVVPLTFCDARWCNGPGPTPTPTGSNPLALLLMENTPPAPPPIEEVEDKVQVSWDHIRVTYLQDNTQTRTAQVSLEICSEPAQLNCEPVFRVFDNALGAPKQVISQFNGMNVFEFAYGYTANLTVEGGSLISPAVWISDPTLR